MDQLSNAEFLTLAFTTFAAMGSEFQYWLSATFAVIVATFIAGDRLTRAMRIWVGVLYVCVSLVFAGRYWFLLEIWLGIADQAANRGIALQSLAGGPASVPASVAGFLRPVVFVLGLGTTIWFLARDRLTHRRAAGDS
jgi:hypothetical protein